MVTDASTTVNVVGVDVRDGLNRSKIEGKTKLPSFETQKELSL